VKKEVVDALLLKNALRKQKKKAKNAIKVQENVLIQNVIKKEKALNLENIFTKNMANKIANKMTNKIIYVT